jgi:hypothetical protein
VSSSFLRATLLHIQTVFIIIGRQAQVLFLSVVGCGKSTCTCYNGIEDDADERKEKDEWNDTQQAYSASFLVVGLSS